MHSLLWWMARGCLMSRDACKHHVSGPMGCELTCLFVANPQQLRRYIHFLFFSNSMAFHRLLWQIALTLPWNRWRLNGLRLMPFLWRRLQLIELMFWPFLETCALSAKPFHLPASITGDCCRWFPSSLTWLNPNLLHCWSHCYKALTSSLYTTRALCLNGLFFTYSIYI